MQNVAIEFVDEGVDAMGFVWLRISLAGVAHLKRYVFGVKNIGT